MSSYTVTISISKAKDALEYAKVNCPSYITNSGIVDPVVFESRYTFYFSQEADATMFALKWV